MYIETLRIKNLRCFREAELNLRFPNQSKTPATTLRYPNVNLLLGDNGTGKTTVLKALALSVIAPVTPSSGFRPYYLVRRNEKENKALLEATAQLHTQDFDKSKTQARHVKSRLYAEIHRREDYESIVSKHPSGLASGAAQNLYKEHSPAFFLVGYGATRRVEDAGTYSRLESDKQRTARYQRVAGLFENQLSLTPLSAWLPEMQKKNKGRFTQIKKLLNDLLPEEARFSGQLLDKDYLFTVRGQSVPYRALSDGYRAYIGWICDLLFHVSMTCPSGSRIDENQGLVLVDEIDLHLHPLWQQRIINSLSLTLPNLQFVFTTHSPIVATSLEKENIFVMTVDAEGTSVVSQFEERIFGKSANQALESTYFGMQSTRPADFLKEVHQLTSLSKQDDPAVAFQIMDKVSGLDTKKEITAAKPRAQLKA